MDWKEKVEMLAMRVREPEASIDFPNVEGQVDIPNWHSPEIEQHLLIAGQELLREIPPDELQAIGSLALKTYTGSGGAINVPKNLIRIVSGRVANTTATEGPAVYAGVANYTQRALGGTTKTNTFTLLAGQILFVGTTAEIVAIVEPPLLDWQSDAPILPQGYELEMIDRAWERMIVVDNR